MSNTLNDLLQDFLREERTVSEIQNEFGISRNTVYRHLAELVEEFVNVRRVNIGRPARFKIEVNDEE